MKRLIINKTETIYDKFDEEYIFVNMDTGMYYSMKGNSSLVLNELEKGTTLQEIVALFHISEGGEKVSIEEEVKTFLKRLITLNILIEEEVEPQEQGELEKTTVPFVGLEIEVYQDMEEVIKIDPIHNIADIEKGVK